MTIIIGLTGSIGTGKSTIAKMFTEFKIPVIDADVVAREVVKPGEAALEQIHEAFGDGVIQADGTLDRKTLGAIVFADEGKRLILNQIIHPAIRKRMEEKQQALIDRKEACIVVDIPLLFENKLTNTVDKVLVVYVDEAEQLRRIVARDGITADDAARRMASQISIEEKVKLADGIIDNTGTPAASFAQLEHLLREWGILQD